MSKEEIVYAVQECLNCQTLNNSLSEFCISCGVLLISEKRICSKCENPIKIDDARCNECKNAIITKELDKDNIKDFYKEEKERFIEIIYKKRSREHIRNKHGEEGFDTFKGYIDWEFLELYDIVEKELEYIPTAKYILSENVSSILHKKYSIKKGENFEEKVKKITENLENKIQTGELLQPFPEVRIGFSIVAEIYNRFYYFENRVFDKDEEEDLARNLLRVLVNFYSTVLHNPYVKDEENTIEKKLILYSSILFDLTYCINLGDSLSDKQYFECENVINERLMRGAMLYEIYKMKKKNKAEKKKIRRLCSEIIADIERALDLQWRVKGKDTKPIFELYVEKLFEFVEEGINLPYFRILEGFISDTYYMYEGVGPFSWGESKTAVPYIIETIDILNRLEENEGERRERIGAYIRAYDFYRKNMRNFAIEMQKEETIIEIMRKFYEKYYEIDTKIEKKDAIRKEVIEISNYIEDVNRKEKLWELIEGRKKEE